MAHPQRMMYVELKSGYGDNGPAWIGRVRFSKTGRTAYFHGKTLERTIGIRGNFVDAETGEEYWVSGVKRDGTDRHWAGSGPVAIDADVRAEYMAHVNPAVRGRIRP
jgi:hypothetical protein